MKGDLFLEYPDSELVIALVYPLGVDRDLALRSLKDHLAKFGYHVNHVRLSGLLSRFDELNQELLDSPENRRVESRMDAGNKARRLSRQAAFVALAGVSEVSKQRNAMPLARTALILDLLKRPEEVAALRRIYGAGFFLLGLFASESERRRYLTRDKNIEEAEADRLMERDLNEADPFGQQTRATFHLADAFVSLDDLHAESGYKQQLWRFVDLMFGHPHQTPTLDEHSMYIAYASSFRSGDLSRQVGAALAVASGDLAAVGCNDVPRAGGGLYWPGNEDKRDAKLGNDSNHARRDAIVDEVISGLDLKEGDRQKVKDVLGESALKEITEYGRAVHAEMEAILACARTGRSPVGGVLYTTTFPCHNCTRHIVAAGIKRVVYIEPYPKSKASELHGDSIHLRDQDESPAGRRVSFEPFVGVGPRRYVDLFSLHLSSGRAKVRKEGSKSVEWSAGASQQLRVPMLPTSYLDRERLAVQDFDDMLTSLGGPNDATPDQG